MTAMKVLHFIPSVKAVAGSEAKKYKLALLETMADYTDVHLLATDASGYRLGRVVVHSYSAMSAAVRWRRRFGGILSMVNPDVVHIHACWNLSAYILLSVCRKRNIPTVLTLDCGLASWRVACRYWLCKLPMLLAFQRRMLAWAGALHAVSDQEASGLTAFGWHPALRPRNALNRRIAVVRPFDRVPCMSAKSMTMELLGLYQKVVDSCPFPQMTSDELKAEDELLRVGMAKGRLACGMEADVLARLSSLGGKSWRRIFLHSADEGIYGYVTDGINEAKLPVGILDTSKVERFVDGAGGHGYVLGKRMVRKLDRGGGELPDLERGLCLSVLTVLQKMRRLCVRRSDFAELCVAMRFKDYNEDIVQAELRRLGAARPAARLLQILKERYGLGEGFMFTQPLDDGKTEVLRRKLFKSNIQ